MRQLVRTVFGVLEVELHLRVAMCVDVCVDTSMDMRMRVGLYTDMPYSEFWKSRPHGLCIDMCIGMCIGMYAHDPARRQVNIHE